jgi:hypothetical protein
MEGCSLLGRTIHNMWSLLWWTGFLIRPPDGLYASGTSGWTENSFDERDTDRPCRQAPSSFLRLFGKAICYSASVMLGTEGVATGTYEVSDEVQYCIKYWHVTILLVG